jgi:hypothetical protein
MSMGNVCCACGYKCNDPSCKRGCDRLTPAERSVIEAAMAYAPPGIMKGNRLCDAVDALRAERAPKPRYKVKAFGSIMDTTTNEELCMSEIVDRLNAAESAK